MAKELTEKQKDYAAQLVKKAREALKEIENLNQNKVDQLCQAIAWAIGNENTFTRLARMGVEESGIGDYEWRPNKRFKILGVLRDCLREKSVGVIETISEKGLIKYAKPAGLIVSLVPTTNPALTPAVTAIPSIKCKDAVIFSPHPRSKNTIIESVNVLRKALENEGITPDVFQCVKEPSFALTHELMAKSDLIMATGGAAMVKSAYSSGKPAYASGAGNATIIIDETANIDEAAMYVRMSKMGDFGSGCSCDGNAVIEESIYDEMMESLKKEGGYLINSEEKNKLQSAMWDSEGKRKFDTIACPAIKIAEKAGISFPLDKKFIIVQQEHIGKEHFFSGEKLSPVLAVYKYSGFDSALKMISSIFEVGGKGHSCSIYSFNEEHIHELASYAPVSRIMVRQPTYLSNAGSFTNGMPMTASLGVGTWGGTITSENIHLKHYMNTTWVSYQIPEDKPSEKQLFGKYYQSKIY